MIETLTLITLCILYLIYFRPGKTPPLNSALVIKRPGRYQATLAPQLNLAQPFIESIVKQLESAHDDRQDSSSQVFEVYDNQVVKHSKKFYLLAIRKYQGMLYFDAYQSAAEIQDDRKAVPEHEDQFLVAAVKEAAKGRGITVKQIAP